MTGAPGNDTVIRRAARIAARSKAELLVLHVIAGDIGTNRNDTAPLEELTRDVGASWETARGEDVATTLVAAAVDHQITQIVIGTSKRSRWQSVTRGAIVQQILRKAADAGIDVHVIARRTERNGKAAANYEE